jgi:hypothetical protein
MEQENCCTPIGQVKRHANCNTCHLKPKQKSLVERMIPLQLKYNLLMMKLHDKMTAVEWLAEKYNEVNWLRNRDEISSKYADELREGFLKQAKYMENEQQQEYFEKGQESIIKIS